MERSFEFTVSLVGRGETEEQAWEDAIDSFSKDPGSPQTTEEIVDLPPT